MKDKYDSDLFLNLQRLSVEEPDHVEVFVDRFAFLLGHGRFRIDEVKKRAKTLQRLRRDKCR